MSYLRNRFQKEANKMAQVCIASIPFGQRLYRQDIKESIAHVKILTKQGIITKSDAEAKKQKLDFWKGWKW
ncbi:MAG: hypothetical protein CO103_05960 [Chloroflexi bacterium CG_4_9_14_3_um_filter_45_9]|nr:MAG: hypothetical protein AUK00_04085 [Dehalococcoidia bacterium CG2_30_46_9]PIU22924.1 MAG: hypothetical protein COT13_05770 [Chloroflexi bacterium CG08_land_8_20_14_0_20_45_12]PIX26981.1 MAG: hypothetical protein COZ67_04755 [Chloroflexi bacterium CG_4_8_14_3_um_filter_45_15]PJB49385.1 MAG: hypothetical protein CO103_05960 [Chloroflexi bacterium CG_4_9_14_3_um_filter_45_9]